jgi:PAS domain-containing protein
MGAAPTKDQNETVAALLARANEELGAATAELEQAVVRAERAEVAHDAAESLVDALLAIATVPVVLLDTELKVLGWSSGCEQRWSVSAADAIGRSWTRLAHNLDAPAFASDDLAPLLEGDLDDVAEIDLGASFRGRAVSVVGGARRLVVWLAP